MKKKTTKKYLAVNMVEKYYKKTEQKSVCTLTGWGTLTFNIHEHQKIIYVV